MHSLQVSSLSAFLVAILLAQLGASTTPANGPTAYISIDSAAPFATMRPCAAGCLVYNGIWSCGFNSGYYDLGIALSCGCSPKNFCYCDSKAAASASSYISSCVSVGCGTAFPGEVTSAIDLYNGYCATATVAAATTPDTATSLAATSVTTSEGTSISKPKSSTSISSGKAQKSSTPNTTETSTPTSTDNKGLSQSDVIALAVGLGVGIPSLLLALATFCISRKNKLKEADSSSLQSINQHIPLVEQNYGYQKFGHY